MSPPLIVQKYGGTSLASTQKIRAVARGIVETRRLGNDLVVVTSAMDQTTDQLMDLARSVTLDPHRRELDMLLATGEITAMALLAIALSDLGERSISLSGAQAGILTNRVHANARILGIETSRLRRELAAGAIVVVAGFQGVDDQGELTTLGRGGSDTTATALAAALEADRCQIFTDVDAVYSADPRIVDGAQPLSELASSEMEEMAWHGAQVLKAEAVEFAKSNGVNFEVLSPYGQGAGTRIRTGASDPQLFAPKKPAVAGVAGRRDLIRLHGEASAQSASASPQEISRRVDEAFRLVEDYDLIFGRLDHNAASFDLLLSDLEIPDTQKLMQKLAQCCGEGLSLTDDLGAVSLIGFGIGSRPGSFLEAFRNLETAGIEVLGSFTGRESLSFLVDRDQVHQGMRALHRIYIEQQPLEPLSWNASGEDQAPGSQQPSPKDRTSSVPHNGSAESTRK